MTEKIRAFIDTDNQKLEQIIEKYPLSVPVPIAAEFLGCHQDTLRSALEDGRLGFSERKLGKVNRGFVIPTGHFVRWYLGI
jgi:hypothetical protein